MSSRQIFNAMRTLLLFLALPSCFSPAEGQKPNCVDLENIVVVVSNDESAAAEQMAATVLIEEIEKRTGLHWPLTTDLSINRNTIILSLFDNGAEGSVKPESYRLRVDEGAGKISVSITGADRRGVLYGVGKFLRMLQWKRGEAHFPKEVDITSSPAYPMRGHQLGYRPLSNSYDAWTPEVYDQYIRELALFGTNSIEFMPTTGGVHDPLMKVDYDVMNKRLSEICAKYGLDYWVQIGAYFDLNDAALRAKDLARQKAMYANYTKLDGIFFPGGDPGENHPKLVMPYIEELSAALKQHHLDTKIWFSLQTFNKEETDYFFEYITTHLPDWFGGLVSGPASPPIIEQRKRLPKRYPLRHYPDITHSTRGQYPVAWWDPALGRTLGRECPNPQPIYYALIHNYFAPYTDGFITYSDGINDDVNKFIWSAKGWDPDVEVREVLKEYARLFFRPDLADRAADGILGLEKNWGGALTQNGAVEATLSYWQTMASEAPELEHNWRWQLCQIRSHYDAYIRRRVIYERELEDQANQMLADASTIGADAAMRSATNILNRAESQPVSEELRIRIEDLGLALFKSIGLQTSVEKYHAYGYERGTIIDFLDLPMNNRLWLEDEFAKVKTYPTEEEKLEQLEVLRMWEEPGEGSFYDDIGTLDRSEHLVRGEGLNTDPDMVRNPNPGFWTWDNGFNRLRLSWLVSMDRPVAMVYEDIDPDAEYDVRVTGYRVAKLQINGEWVEPFKFKDEIGAIVEYHVPRHAIKSGKLTLNWGDPEITEVWLIKKK